MYQNMSTLSELKHKQIHLQQQIIDLKNDMETFNVGFHHRNSSRVFR